MSAGRFLLLLVYCLIVYRLELSTPVRAKDARKTLQRSGLRCCNREFSANSPPAGTVASDSVRISALLYVLLDELLLVSPSPSVSVPAVFLFHQIV